MYKSVKFRVKVNGCLGPEFDSKLRTKQGDPLSPTLFGLYIEQLHYLLQLEAPGIGPILNGINIPDLLYADDTPLFAQGLGEQFQKLLDLLNLFCAIAGLQVNPSKSAVVVFQSPHYKINEVIKRSLKWSFDGVPLPVMTKYRYLEMVFNYKKIFQHAANSLIMPRE